MKHEKGDSLEVFFVSVIVIAIFLVVAYLLSESHGNHVVSQPPVPPTTTSSIVIAVTSTIKSKEPVVRPVTRTTTTIAKVKEEEVVIESDAITRKNVIDAVNNLRIRAGVHSLKENSLLDVAAQAKSDDMAEKGYFSHKSPDGKPFTFWPDSVGYNKVYYGENLAVNYISLKELVGYKDCSCGWFNSAGHYENIVNPHFVETGVGISSGMYQGEEVIFVTQNFGSR